MPQSEQTRRQHDDQGRQQIADDRAGEQDGKLHADDPESIMCGENLPASLKLAGRWRAG